MNLCQKLIALYWCPVNTGNSLFDGYLHSYKPPYRYSTEKKREFLCLREHELHE